jgi:hypothetical protein
MSDSSFGYVKLYHPKGPLVSLPVPMDPKEAFTHIVHCFEAGWLLAAPGLEEGEHKEDVGYILRGDTESNGEVTPYLLLYSTNEGMTFSFLKVYLNNAELIGKFEKCSGMKLSDLREYSGSDKPERGKSAKLDSFIIKAKKPFQVVMKENPKYKEADREAAVKKGEIYKVPKRVFVRWGDDTPIETKEAAKPVNELDAIFTSWKARLTMANIPNVKELNKLLPEIRAIENKDARIAVWGMIKKFADEVDCEWNEGAKMFVVKDHKMIQE